MVVKNERFKRLADGKTTITVLDNGDDSDSTLVQFPIFNLQSQETQNDMVLVIGNRSDLGNILWIFVKLTPEQYNNREKLRIGLHSIRTTKEQESGQQSGQPSTGVDASSHQLTSAPEDASSNVQKVKNQFFVAQKKNDPEPNNQLFFGAFAIRITVKGESRDPRRFVIKLMSEQVEQGVTPHATTTTAVTMFTTTTTTTTNVYPQSEPLRFHSRKPGNNKEKNVLRHTTAKVQDLNESCILQYSVQMTSQSIYKTESSTKSKSKQKRKRETMSGSNELQKRDSAQPCNKKALLVGTSAPPLRQPATATATATVNAPVTGQRSE